MYFGQERNEFGANGAANRFAVKLTYLGCALVNIRGPITGQLYRFSRQQSVQSVNAGDAVSILQTGLFRRTR
jgi:hypothetical protein